MMRCEATIGYTDYDGTRDEAPCGNPATTRLLEPEGTYHPQVGPATWLVCNEHAADFDRDYAAILVDRKKGS